MRAAFAEVDLTPDPGLLLAGMPQRQAATGVTWALKGRVGLFEDDARRVAIVAVDLLALEPATVRAWRQALAAAGGLSEQDILVACSHTHRGPFTIPAIEEARDDSYLDFALARLLEAMAEAADRLEPAELRIGSVAATGWSSNRRPLYRGGAVGTHGPEWVHEFEGREGGADDELQVLLAVRAGDGETIGGFVNFACHPTVVAEDPVYSADFVGPLTEALAQHQGGVFGFLQGASGDISPYDMSQPGRARQGLEHAEQMGRALAEAATVAIERARPVTSPRLRTEATQLQLKQRRPTKEQVRLARWYLEERDGEIDEQCFTREIYGHPYTFYDDHPPVQAWFARDAIALWEMQRNGEVREPSESVEIQAVAIGDLALVAYPAEMFDAFGVGTKAASPFATTMVCALANGWHGYVPTPIAFEHGGYEPRLACSSRLAEEAGDRMVEAALQLLSSLHAP